MASVVDRGTEHVQLAVLEFLHSGNQPQQARLAGAVRADQATASADRQAEGDIAQRHLLAVAMLDARGVQCLAEGGAHCRLAGQSIGAVRT